MNTIFFSLIMATYGRKKEIGAFLESILKQNYNLSKIEIIIVDQNDKIVLDDLIEKYSNKLIIKHIKSNIKGLSYNRNIGLKIAKGDCFAFPDDDCTYYANTLYEVSLCFENSPKIDAFVGQIIDAEQNKKIIRNWPNIEISINKNNFFLLYSSITIFTKRNNLLFEEKLGVGQKFGSYEDADYILQLIDNGPIQYTPNLQVWHPELNVKAMGIDKIKNYSMGFGALCKKHSSWTINLLFIKVVVFHFLKMLIALVSLNILEVKKRFYSATYRIKGYFEYK